MSDLTAIEKLKLEKLFGVESGYVLNFSNRTFSEFIMPRPAILYAALPDGYCPWKIPAGTDTIVTISKVHRKNCPTSGFLQCILIRHG